MPVDFAVVPVAGRGTRLLPLTKSQPKEMLPVGRKPVVQYVVEELARCGIGRLLFVTGPGKTAIENHFDIDAELIAHLRETGKEELLLELAFEREDLEYFYTRQRRQLGLGHAVLCARPVVGRQPFVVALGDSIIGLHAQSQVVRDDDRAVRVAAGRRGDRLRGGAAARRWSTTASPSPATASATCSSWTTCREAGRGRGPEQPGRGRPLRLQPGDLRLPRPTRGPARATRSS